MREAFESDPHPGWPFPLIHHVEWEMDFICTWWARVPWVFPRI